MFFNMISPNKTDFNFYSFRDTIKQAHLKKFEDYP